MSTSIEVLSLAQRKRFDSPPKFSSEERRTYFEYSGSVKKYVRKLRSPNNKASFILQYGYFKAKGRFFEPSQFQIKDINYIYRTFGLAKPTVEFKKADFNKLFGGSNSTRHRNEILRIEGWAQYDNHWREVLIMHAHDQTKKQAPPEEMLYALVSFCWHRVVIPSYDELSTIISQCYLEFEKDAIGKIENQLSNTSRDLLEEIFKPNEKNMSTLAQVRKIEQSTRAQSMKRNAETLQLFSRYYFDNEQLINDIGLSDQATEYYADWILKAKTAQVKQLKDKNKIYLYLLAFIKQQYYKRQDAALNGLMKCIKESLNKASKKATEYEKKVMAAKNKAIDAIRNSERELTQFVGEIIRIIDDSTLSDARKVEILRNRAINIISGQDDEFVEKRDFLDKCREKEKIDAVMTDAIEGESRSLQIKISSIIKVLIFDEKYSNKSLLVAIKYYQKKDGNIGQTPPLEFLSKKERSVVFLGGSLRTSLYKMFLFRHMFDNIKSGDLSLLYSYEWRAHQRYLIDNDDWKSNKNHHLESAGLMKFKDADRYLDSLMDTLESKYVEVNERFSSGHNGYLKMRPNGRFHVKTPAIDYEQSKYISTLLSSEGEIPVLQVLQAIDQDVQFTNVLSHHSNKNVVKDIDSKLVLAGIMGLGCNIGPRTMARRSVGNGISESKLLDCINWRFSKKNLNKTNQMIVDAIDSLPLPNIYKIQDNCIHSSSDGKKVTVAVDSLLANYSYKYYGKEKGVSVYSFIDDKQSLFNPTVISSTDREAIYVVDGLLHNSTSINHIHSTDTHGYTEAVFAATHFINVAFAPRFKRIEDQVIYSFHSKSTYKDQGYRVLPSRRINRKLIEDNWDDMLRFMATIKTGHSTASQLFKRLNSYSKDHPLYKSLKEFGRIAKSLHILNFYDDLEFRQQIQKQLNRVELSNKFKGAVFWDRGKQFQVGTQEEQEKYNLCKTIIQNAIIYWNYLFLSDRLLSTGNLQDRADMIDSIKKGSVLAWKHINFTGEYDFSKKATKDYQFNVKKIKALEIAHLIKKK